MALEVETAGSRPESPRRTPQRHLSLLRLLKTLLPLMLLLRPDFPLADVFSSGTWNYGGGNTTGRTGKQAIQDDSVYCQQTPGGQVIPKPYGGTRRNIPCGLPGAPAPAPPPEPEPCSCAPATNESNLRPRPYGTSAWRGETGAQTCRCEEPWVPVFNYYYINGINTPFDGDGPGTRGNYVWDFGMIRANLLDINATQIGFNQRPRQPASMRVATNERNLFDTMTYNRSGTEPMYTRAGYCNALNKGQIKLELGVRQVADLFCSLDTARASGLGGMSPGDVLECLYQARVSTLSFAADQPEVKEWAGMIRTKYENEQRSREKNFFILIAHSQGNFFAEGVAYRLASPWEGASGQAVFKNRLAILSLASPTDYNALLSDFRNRRIGHVTRNDDGILALQSLGALGAKQPWQGNAKKLWNFSDQTLQSYMQLVAWIPFKGFFSPFLDRMGLAPDTQCEPATNPRCDHALYTPLMNSHLLDNYLTDPPLTMPRRPIHEQVAHDLGGSNAISPEGPPVLTDVRTRLKGLKTELLNAGRNEP